MSSGLLECRKCHKYYDVTIWENGKARYQDLPYKCPHCGALMDFVNGNLKVLKGESHE